MIQYYIYSSKKKIKYKKSFNLKLGKLVLLRYF